MIDIIKMAPKFLPLTLKMGMSLLRLRREAKKAAIIFERELLESGIDKEAAKGMKEDYLETSKILPLLLKIKRSTKSVT